MPSIIIDSFGGMRPKTKRGYGDPSLASLSVNTNLEHGSIRPWRYPSLELETGLDKACSIHKEECCWLASENPCASYTRGDTDCNRIFSTGVMPWPAYAVMTPTTNAVDGACETLCAVEWCRLGVPKPTNAPELIGSSPIRPPKDMPVITMGNYDCTVKGNYKACDYLGDQAGDGGELDDYCDLQGFPESTSYDSDFGKQINREPRSYFYTFVNEFYEESSPSPISEIWDVDVDGNTVLGFNIPPMTGGYCNPTSIRIYRGLPTGAIPNDPAGLRSKIADDIDPIDYDNMVASAFFFVDEIVYREGAFEYNDSIEADCLGEANTSEDNMPPSECLQNIQMTENGSLVASNGKELWFSEPYRFNAWNCAMNLDDCIVNFKVARSAIYVATDAFPYVISTKPNEDADCLCCRNVNKLLEPAPIVSHQSMVITNTGVMWASAVGLVRLSGNAMKIETHDIMSESDWQAYLPHQIKGEYYKGKYFGFNTQKGFVYDLTDGIYSDSYLGESGKFSELSIVPDAVYRTENNNLFMSIDGNIFRWNNSNVFIPYTWRSKLHVESGTRNYSIMKVVFENWLRGRQSPNPVTIRLYSDDKLYFERKVSCSKPFRIPKGIDGINFMIEVTGIENVNQIHMATSKVELTQLNNT